MLTDSLTATPEFAAWVANTVHAVSGIWPDFSRLDGECALTFVLSRMPACQDGFDDYFAIDIAASVRHSAVVVTNNVLLH